MRLNIVAHSFFIPPPAPRKPGSRRSKNNPEKDKRSLPNGGLVFCRDVFARFYIEHRRPSTSRIDEYFELRRKRQGLLGYRSIPKPLRGFGIGFSRPCPQSQKPSFFGIWGVRKRTPKTPFLGGSKKGPKKAFFDPPATLLSILRKMG